MSDHYDYRSRVAALDAVITGKGGLLDRFDHLEQCVDRLKGTVWKASGALGAVFVCAQWLLK